MATEDVLYLLHGLGIVTGVDLDAIVSTGQWITEQLGARPAPRTASRVGNALYAKRAA